MDTKNRLILENDKCIFYENSFTDVANKELKSHGIKYKCFWVKLKNENIYLKNNTQVILELLIIT